MTFEETGLSPALLEAVSLAGYTSPTPIQEKAIPLVLRGRDVMGLAQTGTGKTASFALPLLDMLSRGRAKARMPRSLILEPTRELAAQVAESFKTYGKDQKLTMALLIGGVPFADQIRSLDRGADILIATPGRLLDHFERGKVLLGGVKFLVVDEADRMLDMGFIPAIERIVKVIPATRQTLLFSATMPSAIERLSRAFLRDPDRVEVSPKSVAADSVDQSLVWTGGRAKIPCLTRLLRGEDLQNALIFCNRKRDVEGVRRGLERAGFTAAALHGDMDQHARMATLARFRSGEEPVLVASNVAARGLDIPEVSHVVNFDVPQHAEDYVHRIGRTGRAGSTGWALMLASADEEPYVAAIEALIGSRIPLSKTSDPRPMNGDGERSGSKRRGGGSSSKGGSVGRSVAPPAAGGRRGASRKREGSAGLGDHVPAFLRR